MIEGDHFPIQRVQGPKTEIAAFFEFMHSHRTAIASREKGIDGRILKHNILLTGTMGTTQKKRNGQDESASFHAGRLINVGVKTAGTGAEVDVGEVASLFARVGAIPKAGGTVNTFFTVKEWHATVGVGCDGLA